MSRQGWTRVYVALVLVASLGVFVATTFVPDPLPQGRDWYFGLLLGAMIAFAVRYPLWLSGRTRVVMDTAPILAAIVLLPAPFAIAVCTGGKAAGQLFRHSSAIRRVYNISAMAAQAGLSALVFELATHAGRIPEGQVIELFGTASAALVLYGTNALLTEGIVSLSTGRRLFRGWWTAHHADLQHQASLLLIGAFAAMVADARPWSLPVIVVPTAVVYRSFKIHREQFRLAEAAQFQAEEARNRLADIVQESSDFVITAAPDGTILYANGAAGAAFGMSAEDELPGQRVSQFIANWDTLAERASEDGRWSGESAFVIDGRATIPVSQVVVAHRNADGSVRFLSVVARDIGERKRFEDHMVHLATHDALTGLLNRRRFDEVLAESAELVKRQGGRAALLFIDLDRFKAINDTLGHRAGDEMLCAVAASLVANVPAGARVARLGGDEFGVIFEAADSELACRVAEVIRTGIREIRVESGGATLTTTASIGLVELTESVDAAEALTSADLAMYEAKRDGDAWRMYSPDDDRRAEIAARVHWERRVRAALDDNAFVVQAQPIHTVTGEPEAYELLLRMREPSGRLVAPTAFLPAAERSGLIALIDRWVISEALQLIHRSQLDGDPLTLAVNLSGRTLQDREVPGMILDYLTAEGVDPQLLIIEITETVAIADLAEARRFIEPLHAAGVRFAIDDFGAGYSSFSYLRNLPVDLVKIDGEFIRHLPRESEDQHLVRAMVEVAHGLHKKVVAEYVEDERTWEIVRALGVDYVQGHYFGKAGGIPDLIAARRAKRTDGRAAA